MYCFLGKKSFYLLKGSNRNTRKRCEISSTLTVMTPERRQRRRSGVVVIFENSSHLFSVSIGYIKQINVSWEGRFSRTPVCGCFI